LNREKRMISTIESSQSSENSHNKKAS
jgi:hypothetical protein